MMSADKPSDSLAEVESGKESKMRYFSFGIVKYFICIIIPFALIPLALSSNKEARCSYVILWMILYWTLQPVHISVTALLPVPLYPLLGILDTDAVARNYMKEVLMMFLGGLGVAVAVEHCNLHKRIALNVLLALGTHIKWLLLGFMSTSMFLSMWVSNSATTAMMVPIIDAVMGELHKGVDRVNGLSEDSADCGMDFKQLHKILLLGVAYSANFGGTGTLTGTSPNMILKGFMDTDFPESNNITYATWIAYNIPGMIIGVFATWIVLQVLFVPCWHEEDQESQAKIRSVIHAKYEEMGTITFHEVGIMSLFIILVILWVFRDPKFMPGWISLLDSTKKIGDAVPAIMILILMFILPAKPWLIHKSPPLLTWKVLQDKLPWGLVLLLGGGYAMAHGAKESGLSDYLSHKMTVMSSLKPTTVLFIVFIIATTLTEVMSNSAVTSIFLPVVIQMALAFRINPLYLMLPVPLAASYAFMLPVSTGPNAIIFGTGHLKSIDMIKAGLIMKLICLLLQLVILHTLGDHMFHLGIFPKWANVTQP